MKHLFFSLMAAVMLAICYNPSVATVKTESIEYAQIQRKKPKTVNVKSHNRKTKSGKITRVKKHKRSK